MNQQNLKRITRRTAVTGLSMIGLGLAASAVAQTYPNRPIKIVHSGAPGGPQDVLARALGEVLRSQLGQPVIVESKPGGLGVIVVGEVLGAKADGYTLLVGAEGLVTETPHSLKVRFDPLKDIKVVAELCDGPLLLVANASLPYSSLPEFVAFAKKSAAKKVAYGTWGPGSLAHLGGLYLSKEARIELEPVHYKTSTAELLDVLGGHIPVAFVGELGIADYVKAGKLRVLAVAGTKRSLSIPAAPTFAELGFPAPELVLTSRLNLFLKAGTSMEVRERLRAAVAAGLQQDSMRSTLVVLGKNASAQRSEEDIEQHIRSVFESNGAALRAVGIQPE